MSDLKTVLDACCGSRMFWFDKQDPRAIYIDNRKESHSLKDRTCKSGTRTLEVAPDILADFTALPFCDNTFSVTVFDPPHLTKAGDTGWQRKKYGRLDGEWKEMLRKGFSECFRVTRPLGTIIFKWNEQDVPVSQILALTPHKPLVGQRCGKSAKTHWIVFLKQQEWIFNKQTQPTSQNQ